MEIKRIMCCCGQGLGSSMIVSMNVERTLKKLGISGVSCGHTALSEINESSADLFVVGNGANLVKENAIRFADFRCFEDVMFIVRTIVLAQNISYINTPYYNYRIRISSTLRANEERYIDLINITKAVKDYLLKQDLMDDFESNFEYFCVSNIYRVYVSMTSEDYKRNLLELCEEVLDEHLLAELQKKILCSVKVWKNLLLNPKNFKQQLENDFYLRKYLNN